MLPELFLYVTIVTNVVVLIFVLYFLFSLRIKEKRLEKKENVIDSGYHHVVDEAIAKERKILDDATHEADQIITGAQYITHTSKDEVSHAIKDLVTDIQKEGGAIAKTFADEYTHSLQSLTTTSLREFQTIMMNLQSGMKQQIQQFHESLLPEIEKELETYKATRMKQIDVTVIQIIEKAAQEIFNKSVSITDQQNTVIDALDRAKKEGVFD